MRNRTTPNTFKPNGLTLIKAQALIDSVITKDMWDLYHAKHLSIMDELAFTSKVTTKYALKVLGKDPVWFYAEEYESEDMDMFEVNARFRLDYLTRPSTDNLLLFQQAFVDTVNTYR